MTPTPEGNNSTAMADRVQGTNDKSGWTADSSNSKSNNSNLAPNTDNSITMVLAPVVHGATEPASVVPDLMEGMMVSLPVPAMETVTESDSPNYPGPNSDNNSMTMVPAPVVHGVTDTDMVKGLTAAEAAKAAEDGWNKVKPNSNNNSMTMVVPVPADHGESPAPMEGTMGQEGEGWTKVKPSKKKHKVKPSKKQQKKLTFKKTPREASKSGPMEVDPQGIDSGTGGGNIPPRQSLWSLLPRKPQRRESL
jgi:hypothetical protein